MKMLPTARTFKCNYSLLTGSGSDSIYLSLMCLNLKPGEIFLCGSLKNELNILLLVIIGHRRMRLRVACFTRH